MCLKRQDGDIPVVPKRWLWNQNVVKRYEITETVDEKKRNVHDTHCSKIPATLDAMPGIRVNVETPRALEQPQRAVRACESEQTWRTLPEKSANGGDVISQKGECIDNKKSSRSERLWVWT
jgi:hypothetical protein